VEGWVAWNTVEMICVTSAALSVVVWILHHVENGVPTRVP
jgi:hypothetical protein